MNILQKINNFALILLLLIWPWQTRCFLVQGASEYLTRSVYVSDLVVIALLVVFGVSTLCHSREGGNPESRSMKHSLLQWKVKLGCCLFWIPDQVRDDTGNRDNKSKAINILKYFFLGLIPVALLAIAQFLIQTTWSTKWLGLAKHDPAILGQVVIETANGRYLRAYGSFDHPNILGGVMAVALLLLLIKKEQWGKFESFLTILFSTALFVSFSRTAWLGLIVALIVYYAASVISSINDKSLKVDSATYKGFLRHTLKLRRHAVTSVRNDRKFLIILFSVFTVLSLIYSNLLSTRISVSGRLEQKSINERVSYYTEAKELFLAQPYFGVGFKNYVSTLMSLKPGQPAWSYQPVHNTFVLALVELGVVRVLLFIFIMWYFLRPKNNEQGIMNSVGVITLFSLIIVLMLFDHWLWSLHVGWLFIGLLVVISVRLFGRESAS